MTDCQKMQDILACPMCHGKLAYLSCTSCNLTYQRNNGIPSFICREMYPSDEAYAEALRIIDFWGNGWEKRLADPEHKPWFECDREALVKVIEKDIEFQKEADSVLAVDLPLDSLKNKVALNIGCGAGNEALLLAYSGANCIAMDITSQAAQAAEYLMHKIDADGVGIQADTRFIPLESSSVDVVYSSGVLHHSPEIAQSIAEIYRVLKPGGKAYIMLYATWSVLFVQMRLMLSMGEKAVNGDQKARKYGAAFFSGIENALWGIGRQPRSRVKGRLRPYAAWRSAPLMRRRGDTLGHGCERGISALTTCKQALFSAIFTRIYTAANKGMGNGRQKEPMHHNLFNKRV